MPAPDRATTLSDDSKERKKYPVASGVLDYFPDALVAVARVSWQGNEQHNPGTPVHWDRAKSQDEADTLIRHFLQRGSVDADGMRHSAKVAWRALALLQKEIEGELAQEVVITPVIGPNTTAAVAAVDNPEMDYAGRRPQCAARSSLGYQCTRPAGHRGDHAAHVGRTSKLYDQWINAVDGVLI